VEETNPFFQTNVVLKCEYDALGRRVARLVPNGSNWDRTDYYSAGFQVLEERFAENQADPDTVASDPQYQYVWGMRYVHAPVLRDADTDADGDCTDDGGSERLYYTQDANFNVTSLVEPDGDVVERVVYDPYGKPTFLKADWTLQEVSGHADGAASAYANEILFTGHRLDPHPTAWYRWWLEHRGEYGTGEAGAAAGEASP